MSVLFNPSTVGSVVVAPTLNSVAAATANTTAINAALAGGGLVQLAGQGICYINAPLIIGSNTRLIVDPALTIQQVPNTNKNLLQSNAFNRGNVNSGFTSVTMSWTSGLTATVNWNNHGLSRDQAVWIKGQIGTTDTAFMGTFKIISITNANAFVVQLERLPAAVPSGTISALLADQNIIIEGGIWNYDQPNNSAQPNTPDQFTMVMCGIYSLTVRDATFKDPNLRNLTGGAINNFRVQNLGSVISTTISGSHDFAHVQLNAPLFNGIVDGLWGYGVDDFFACETYDGGSFITLDMTGGGDMLNVELVRIDANAGAASVSSAVAIYSQATTTIDNIKISNVVGTYTGHANIKIQSNANPAGNIGSITLEGVEITFPDSGQPSILINGVFNRFDSLTFRDCSTPSVSPSTGNCYGLQVSTGANPIGVVTVEDSTFLSNPGTLLFFDGATSMIIVKNCKVDGEGAFANNVVLLTANANVRKIIVEDCYLNNIGSAVWAQPGGTVDAIELKSNYIVANNVILDQTTPFTAYNVSNNYVNCSNFVFSSNSGANPKNINSAGNSLAGGAWLHKGIGSEQIQVFGWDFQVDISALVRATGQFCDNTNAALGTLGTAGLVTCQGTAANSWHLLANPTLVY